MKFAVKVHNEFLSRAIQELAFKNGCRWCDGAVCMDIVSQYPDGDGVLFLEDKEITHCNVFYVESRKTNTPLFDAKTDWDKIEQAMKPKEPRVIWVRYCEHPVPADERVFDSEPDKSKFGFCCSFAKFQEVI